MTAVSCHHSFQPIDFSFFAEPAVPLELFWLRIRLSYHSSVVTVRRSPVYCQPVASPLPASLFSAFLAVLQRLSGIFTSVFAAYFRKGKCVVYTIYVTLSNLVFAVCSYFLLPLPTAARSSLSLQRPLHFDLTGQLTWSTLAFQGSTLKQLRPLPTRFTNPRVARRSLSSACLPAGTKAKITRSPRPRQIAQAAISTKFCDSRSLVVVVRRTGLCYDEARLQKTIVDSDCWIHCST